MEGSTKDGGMGEGRAPVGLLARLGLARPEQRAWAMYDWANSAMVLIVVTAVFPLFFEKVAARDLEDTVAQYRYSMTTAGTMLLVALVAPLLATVADVGGFKKRLLAIFLGLGLISTAAMFWIGPGDWGLALGLFALANVGATGSFVFYDSLLPHVARGRSEMDRLSTSAYALGYLGSGLLLAACLVVIQRPELVGLPSGEGITAKEASLPSRLSFLAVALWWGFFALPLFRRVPEPPASPAAAGSRQGSLLVRSLREFRHTLRALRGFRQAFWMLLAFLLYNDGINTIIRMAAIYATQKEIGEGVIIASILLVQFIGVPFAVLFGRLAERIGGKRSVLCALVVYLGITLLAFYMHTAAHFIALAVLVGMVQGGTQALSRSMFASMIPRHKSAEFFSFFAVAEKFAAIFGPLLFALAIQAFGSSQSAILSIALFFLAGGALLFRVDVEEGQRAARAAEAEAGFSD